LRCRPVCLDDWVNSDGTLNYNREAVTRVAAGLAPNLKKVSLLRSCAGQHEAVQIALWSPRPPWPGFIHKGFSDKLEVGALQRLQLADYGLIQKHTLEDWKMHINFSALRTLQVETALEPDALEYLTSSCDFVSLTTLTLAMKACRSSEPPPLVYDLDLHSRFICSLPPLSNAILIGPSLSTFEDCLKHHGSTLRVLRLSSPQDYDQLIRSD